MILRRMQALLSQLYDAPVVHDVGDYWLGDRRQLASLLDSTDEQLVLVQDHEEVRVGLYVDQQVIERLERSDPLLELNDGNLPDYCTALEGVSHFHYLMWSLERGRSVSLLELELQADVDKYASALTLLTRQRDGTFPWSLHTQLFHRVGYLPQLEAEARQRYEEANRHAACFCRRLEEKFLRRRCSRPEAWLSELRRFFRCGYQEKLRVATF